MANSKCGKCEGSSFEVVNHEPRKSNFKLLFVQCASCGTVVGAMDFHNIGALIYKLAQKLRIDLDS